MHFVLLLLVLIVGATLQPRRDEVMGLLELGIGLSDTAKIAVLNRTMNCIDTMDHEKKLLVFNYLRYFQDSTIPQIRMLSFQIRFLIAPEIDINAEALVNMVQECECGKDVEKFFAFILVRVCKLEKHKMALQKANFFEIASRRLG